MTMRATLRPGELFVLHGATLRLVAIDGAEAILRDPEGTLQAAPVAALAPATDAGVSASATAQTSALATASNAAQSAAEERIAIVRQLLWGSPSSDANTSPVNGFDPKNTTLSERLDRMVDVLSAGGKSRTRRTLERWISRYRSIGVAGLLDGNAVVTGLAPGVPDAVRDVLHAVVDRLADGSTRTARYVIEETLRISAETLPEEVPLPSRATMYRLITREGLMPAIKGETSRRRATARRRPDKSAYRTVVRAGERVEIDTTVIDVFAAGLAGRLFRPHLVGAVCSGTGRVVGVDLCDGPPDGPTLAALLVHIAQGSPELEVPPFLPEELVIDRGSDYQSSPVRYTIEALGITVIDAPPRRPEDKGVVERTFGTLNTRHWQRYATYTSRSAAHRGKFPVGAAPSLEQLRTELIDHLRDVHQHLPVRTRSLPETPGKPVSPRALWDAMCASTGLGLTVSTVNPIFALRPEWRTISKDSEVTLGNVRYRGPVLHDLRGRRSPWAAHGGKWPVRRDPRDVRRVWVQTDEQTVVPLEAVGLPVEAIPFGTEHLRLARLADRSRFRDADAEGRLLAGLAVAERHDEAARSARSKGPQPSQSKSRDRAATAASRARSAARHLQSVAETTEVDAPAGEFIEEEPDTFEPMERLR